MAVIRVEKRKGYTIMSNYHLRDKNLSLKAKGLLSIMLSLPDEWHYNVRGLAAICKEGVTSISSTLKELEQWGYMRRHQPNKDGKFGEIEYIIYETPRKEPVGGDDMKSPKSNTTGDCESSDCLQGNKSDLGSAPTYEQRAAGDPLASADAFQDMAEIQADRTVQSGFFTSSVIGQEPCVEPPHTDFPYTDSPFTENPNTENPDTENSYTQNPDSNKRKSTGKKERQIMDQSNHLSIHHGEAATLREETASQPDNRDAMEEAIDMDDEKFLKKIGAQKLHEEFEVYRQLVMDNIEFDAMIQRYQMEADTIRGIVDIMVEAICSTAPTIRIGGQDLPQKVVKSRLLKLNSGHIEYVMTCLAHNTTKIRNMKNYLLTTLYNAPSTMDAFYQNWVQSDNPAMARRW